MGNAEDKRALKAQVEAGEAGQATVAPNEEDYAKSLDHLAGEEGRLQIVSFYLDGNQFAFEVGDAVEVVRPRAFTELPRTPEFLKGIISVRGEIVPLIDLKKRLGVGSFEGSPTGRVLIASFDDLKVGFLVDRMAAVEEVPFSSVRPPGESAALFQDGFVKGVVKLKKRSVFLLSVERIAEISEP